MEQSDLKTMTASAFLTMVQPWAPPNSFPLTGKLPYYRGNIARLIVHDLIDNSSDYFKHQVFPTGWRDLMFPMPRMKEGAPWLAAGIEPVRHGPYSMLMSLMACGAPYVSVNLESGSVKLPQRGHRLPENTFFGEDIVLPIGPLSDIKLYPSGFGKKPK